MTNQLTEESSDTVEQDGVTLDFLIEQKRYQVLKRLLLSEEDQRLKQIESVLQNPKKHAEKIASVLPQAIQKTDENELYDSLNSCIQACTADFVRNNPDLYADVLYPVIFPAIKKSIAEAIKEMMQSINSAIEEGLSLNRLVWYFEALRSGVPYREIVLRHTLAYQVEQAFLIHRETGLLLRHVSLSGIDQLRDSDAVSAMLTAIQDFIKDSFSVNTDDYLDSVEIGNYTVFLNRGPYAVLACVIRGIAPHSLREKFETNLLNIHQRFSPLLRDFNGDSAPLAVVDPYLQACLLSARKQLHSKNVSPKYTLFFVSLACIALAYIGYDNWQLRHRAQDYLQLLQQNQSIIITQKDYEKGQLQINGLYDPLLGHPDTLIEKTRLKKHEVAAHWLAYQSLVPALVEQRLKAILQPPATASITVINNRIIVSGAADSTWIDTFIKLNGSILLAGISEVDRNDLKSYDYLIKQQLQMPDTVTFSFKNGELTLQGVAPISWHQTLAKKIATLDFVAQYQVDNLAITEAIQLQELTAKINSMPIYFLLRSAELKEKELAKLLDIIAMLKEANTLSQQLNRTSLLVVTGYADGIGTLKKNRELAQSRADVVQTYMKQQGVYMASELGELQLGIPGNIDITQRKVNFSLVFRSEKTK